VSTRSSVEESPMEQHKRGTRSEIFPCVQRAIGFLEHPAITLSLMAGLLVLGTLQPIGVAFCEKIAVDALLSLAKGTFHLGVFLGAAVGLSAAIISGLAMHLRVGIVEKLAEEMRNRLVAAVLAMPLIESERKARGDLVSRLTSDINTGARVFTSLYFFSEITLKAIVSFIYMLLLNWQVGLACAAAGPLLILVGSLLAKPLYRASSQFQSTLGELSSTALDTIEGVAVIKSFVAEDIMENSFVRTVGRARRAGLKVGLLSSLSNGWTGFGSLLPFVIAFVYGGYMAVAGSLSLGSVLALVILCNNLAWPLSYLGQHISDVAKAAGALKRVFEVMDEPAEKDPDVDQPSRVVEEGQVLTSLPAIEVKSLSFKYDEGQPVLKDVSFRVDRGAFVAIVGRSGCGKSTLLKILAGLYRPSPGCVFVLGHDAYLEAISRVRREVAYLPQEPFLFPGTIEENVELGGVEVSRDDILSALQLAQASDIISSDPAGLARAVGERGTALSGGERQRIAIARTILRNAEILILDEPTSSVDKESESRIWDTLQRLMKGKTTVLVSHRLDVASKADLILVMDSGRIVESGKHEELMVRSSLYRSFYMGETASGASEARVAGAAQ